MANKKNKNSITKIEKPLVKLNALFGDVIDNISYGANRSDASRQKELNSLTKDIDSIIGSQVNSLTDFTGEDISTFLVKILNEYDDASYSSGGLEGKSIDDIFNAETGGIFEIFNERYKNKNLLYEDLQTLSDHLFELEEAINSTRDAILSSDDVGTTVSRSLTFKNIASGNTSIIDTYTKSVEKMEKNLRLLNKIKSHIVPNALKYGNFYIYTIPYSKLFEGHHQKLAKDRLHYNTTMESFNISDAKVIKEAYGASDMDTKIVDKMDSYASNFETVNDNYAIPVIEGIDVSMLFGPDANDTLKDTVKHANKKPKGGSTLFYDGVQDKTPDYNGIKDCYVELIDPRKIIPVKVLNKIIGYYYIHELTNDPIKNVFSNSLSLNNGTTNMKEAENLFIGKLADKIVQSFDKKFLEENVKFKSLIANALIYNDLYRKKLKFQFIPVDYMTEIPVNMNMDDEGTSILQPALFYAKLYLGILTFKIMAILSKSNDTQITYIKNSGVDKDIVSQINNIARGMRSRDINFNDIMESNPMTSKIGQSKNIYMPIGRSGEKAMEFDILAGQDVQLNTELMEMLRSGYISATGVPSVIMNYVNEADYAKTLVMANAKFVGRIVSHQTDFNDGLTELYKKCLKYSTDIPAEYINAFEFTLSAPKSLNNNNLTDLVASTEVLANYIIKTITGENADQTDKDNKLKDILFNKINRELLPMIQWNKMDELKHASELELAAELVNSKEDTGMEEE